VYGGYITTQGTGGIQTGQLKEKKGGGTSRSTEVRKAPENIKQMKKVLKSYL